MALTVLVALLTLVLVALGLYQFWADLGETARLQRVVTPEVAENDPVLRRSRLDRLVLRSRLGPTVQTALAAVAIPLRPAQLVVAVSAFCVLLGLVLGMLLSWLLFPVGVLVGYRFLRGQLNRLQERRREEFIAQMPELARTISNASSAGLSIRTALAMAADELGEPARTEMRQVAEEVNLGVPLDTALENLEKRLPSRELAVLVNSLVVSSRSGGALVSALRDIAETLETRKELRREIRTTYSQIVATAYAVLAVGIGAIFLLEAINSGTVDAMLQSPIGLAALVFAGAVYSGAIWTVRRMTRVDI